MIFFILGCRFKSSVFKFTTVIKDNAVIIKRNMEDAPSKVMEIYSLVNPEEAIIKTVYL